MRHLRVVDWRILMWGTFFLATLILGMSYRSTAQDNHQLIAYIQADAARDKVEQKNAAQERDRLLRNQMRLRDDIATLVDLLEQAGIEIPDTLQLPTRRTTVRVETSGGGGSGGSSKSRTTPTPRPTQSQRTTTPPATQEPNLIPDIPMPEVPDIPKVPLLQ